MSITDELRKTADDIASTAVPCGASPDYIGVRRKIDAIADRIDAKHDEMHDFCERLERAVTNREDVTLWGVDYTALPLDADGVPVHIGDRVENGERVSRIVLTDGSWEPSVYVEMLPNVLHEHFCHEIGHYHAPTVEEVLEELLREYDRDDSELTNGEIIEMFAKRLTLADGEDA